MLDGGETLRQALESCHSQTSNDPSTTTVYHVASVFGPTQDHRQTALDNVAGTEDLVRTLAEFRSSSSTDAPHKNCQLVLTSSMAAVRGAGQEPAYGKYYT